MSKQDNSAWLDLAKTGIIEGAGVLKIALTNPVVSAVGAVALTEYLQGVEVFKGKYGWVNYSDRPFSYWGQIKEPLISQTLANTLEAGVFLTEAMKAFGSIPGLANLLPLLLKG